ncbi:MAG: hypothetical protein ACR2ML_11850 [Solirubrobacteraceae bacterium]
MANVEGKATAITVLTPMRPRGRFVLAVVFWVGRHLTATLKKLQQLSFIHYARWAVIERFPDGGGGERPHRSYLLFESNFNGTWDQYIDAFSEVVPLRMKAIWGSSYGFPGPIPAGPFKSYIRRNEFVANHYWSAYPGATTTEIIAAARVAAALERFRRSSSELDPEAFKVAYDALLESVQGDL